VLNIETVAIIEELYRSPDIDRAIAGLAPVDIRGDLKNEVFVIILEKNQTDKEFIEKGNEEGWLKWWVVRVVLNLIKDNSQRFAKSLNKTDCQIIDEIDNVIDDECDHEVRDNEIEKLKTIYENLHWADKQIFDLVVNKKSITKFAEETGIPRRSLTAIIKRIKFTIHYEYGYDYFNTDSSLPSVFRKVKRSLPAPKSETV
jgi:hypothetical protein